MVIDNLDATYVLRLAATDRPALAKYVLESVRRLEGAGAHFAVITSNTTHIVFDEVAARCAIPLISIVETCADEAARRRLRRCALIGARFTMESSLYPSAFARRGLEIGVNRPGFDIAQEEARMAAAGRQIGFGPQDLYPDAVPCLEALRASGVWVGVAGNQPARAERDLLACALPVDMIGVPFRRGYKVVDVKIDYRERIGQTTLNRFESTLWTFKRLWNARKAR